MSSLIDKIAKKPSPLNFDYEALDGKSVKLSVVVGNARTGTPFFFLDDEDIVNTPGIVTVTPRTITFADGKWLWGKVLTIEANIRRGNAVSTDNWSMRYTLSGGNPATKVVSNPFDDIAEQIVHFEDTITFKKPA